MLSKIIDLKFDLVPKIDTFKYLISRSILETATDGKKVFLGSKLFMYASAVQHHHPLIELAKPVIKKLVLETGEIAEQTKMVDWKEGILISERGKRPYWWGGSGSGFSSPLPLTSAGQLLCDHMSLEDINSIFGAKDFAYAGENKINANKFYNSCQTAKKNGYGLTNGLLDRYLSAIALPLYDKQSRVVATVCVVFPSGELPSRFEEFIDKATKARDLIKQAAPSVV